MALRAFAQAPATLVGSKCITLAVGASSSDAAYEAMAAFVKTASAFSQMCRATCARKFFWNMAKHNSK